MVFFGSYSVLAQAPSVVKAVGSTVLQPASADQEGWKSNEWNGLFFYQGTGSPTKLCVTDGTNAGTEFLADIGGGTVVSTIPAQDFMYIITNRLASFTPIAYEAQIWKSNGTAAGTLLVYTMPQAGISNSNVWTSDRDAKRNFSVSGNSMYFNGYDAANGNELWVTDGTATGTHIVKDINAGTGSSNPLAFCKLGSDIYFTAIESSGRKLWKTDGTGAGTLQIPVAEPFFILDNAVGIVNNKMIFYAHNTVDGYEPYVSDGTAAGTFMLANINPSGNSWISLSQNAHLRFNSKYCFFIANNGTANALWRTDGTSAGTIQLTSNAQGAFSGVSGGGYTDVDESGLWMIQYNSAGSGNNEKLYRSDGTVAGTYLVTTGLSYAQYIKIYKNGLWMASRNTSSTANTEPWRSGGNAPTTNKAFEIEPGNSGSPTFTPLSSNPYGFFVKNNKLYFFASTSIPSGHNLYQYQGGFIFNTTSLGNWSDTANWSGRLLPGITDSVILYLPATISGQTAYAGDLYFGSVGNITLPGATDSLIINTSFTPDCSGAISNSNGVVAFYNYKGDTVHTYNGFVAPVNLAILSNTSHVTYFNVVNQVQITQIGKNLNIKDGARLIVNSRHLNFYAGQSTITTSPGSYIAMNGLGSIFLDNLGPAGFSNYFTLPVGTNSSYLPVRIQNIGTTGSFKIRVANGLYNAYSGDNPTGSPYTTGAVSKTWYITEIGHTGSNVNLELEWPAAAEMPSFDRSQTYLGHYTSGSWNLGTPGATSGSNPYTFIRTGITSFSPFGIMNNNATLPLTFLSFSAQKCNTNQVCLTWKTSNEQNVSHFEIERSTDGINFTTIAMKHGNNQVQNTYAAIDDVSAIQSMKKIYYRIKEVDNDGRSKQSNINLVQLDSKGVSLYPTLVSSSVTIQNNSGEKMQLLLLSADGRVISQQLITKGTNIISTEKLTAGLYIYKITGMDEIINSTGRIIKQ